MRTIIIGLIFAAIVLAGGAAYLVNNYLSSQQAEIASLAPTIDMTEVLVASANLPIGTEINDNNVTWTGWPEDGVIEGYIVMDPNKDTIEDLKKEKLIVRRGIQKGEPIVMERLFKRDSPGFLKATLGPGMRAIPVRINPESATSGFILPGDRVDILLTHNLLKRATTEAGIEEDSQIRMLDYVTEIILEDVRVIAIDQKTDEFVGGVAIGGLMLVEVSRKDAEKLILAKNMGTTSVLLRSIEPGTDRPDGAASPGFTTDVEVSPLLENIEAILSGASPASAKPAATVSTTRPTAQPVPTSSGGKITIYRGSSAAGGN